MVECLISRRDRRDRGRRLVQAREAEERISVGSQWNRELCYIASYFRSRERIWHGLFRCTHICLKIWTLHGGIVMITKRNNRIDHSMQCMFTSSVHTTGMSMHIVYLLWYTFSLLHTQTQTERDSERERQAVCMRFGTMHWKIDDVCLAPTHSPCRCISTCLVWKLMPLLKALNLILDKEIVNARGKLHRFPQHTYTCTSSNNRPPTQSTVSMAIWHKFLTFDSKVIFKEALGSFCLKHIWLVVNF